jgi:transaldolase
VVVADSGKITEIEKYKPQDSTTNPTLILEAVNLPEYRDIVESAVRKGIDHFMNKKV